MRVRTLTPARAHTERTWNMGLRCKHTKSAAEQHVAPMGMRPPRRQHSAAARLLQAARTVAGHAIPVKRYCALKCRFVNMEHILKRGALKRRCKWAVAWAAVLGLL
jgi:hypothetical protein